MNSHKKVTPFTSKDLPLESKEATLSQIELPQKTNNILVLNVNDNTLAKVGFISLKRHGYLS